MDCIVHRYAPIGKANLAPTLNQMLHEDCFEIDEDITDISLFLEQSTQIEQEEEEDNEEEETSDYEEFDDE